MTDALHPVLIKLFSCDSKDQADLLLQYLTTLQLASGDILFSAGDPADDLYFLVEGRVVVKKTIGIGDRVKSIALLNSGTVIGEAALLEDRLRTTTVSAIEDSTLAFFSKQALADFEQAAPSAYIKMMKKIVSITSLRLHKSSERLALVL